MSTKAVQVPVLRPCGFRTPLTFIVRSLLSNTGIGHPNTLDLVTQGETEIFLVLVEERALSIDDASALQDKLNNYLEYILDGHLLHIYPAAQGKAAHIRIDLYASPVPFVLEFVQRYREAVAQYGVRVDLAINGSAVP